MSDDCIICGKWPEADHWALREMLDTLPLNDEPICDRCQSLSQENPRDADWDYLGHHRGVRRRT
jgi:hypothetical protein